MAGLTRDDVKGRLNKTQTAPAEPTHTTGHRPDHGEAIYKRPTLRQYEKQVATGVGMSPYGPNPLLLPLRFSRWQTVTTRLMR